MPTGSLNRTESIKAELEGVRLAFLRVLEEIPADDWDCRFQGEGWTARQELFHITQALGILPNGIRRAVRGSRWHLLAVVPTRLRGWVNGYIVIPIAARKATRQSIAAAYEKAHARLVSLLEELPEDAWGKAIAYPRKKRTVEQIAHRPAEHFAEHEAHLRHLLGLKPEKV